MLIAYQIMTVDAILLIYWWVKTLEDMVGDFISYTGTYSIWNEIECTQAV